MKKWLSTLAVTVIAAGCSSVPERDFPVNALPDQQDGIELTTLWDVNSGEGRGEAGDALVPAIDDDKAYVADRRGKITAWDAETGDRSWGMDLGRNVTGGPTVDGDLMVVGTREGRVVAIDTTEQAVLWTESVTSEVLSVPALSRDQVLVISGDERLFALRRDTGARRWIYDRTMPELTLRGSSNPQVAGSLVLAGLANGRLVAVQLSDGSLAWQADVGIVSGSSDLERMRDIDGAPVIRGDAVYVVGYQSRVMALGLRDGRSNWTRDLSSYAGLDVDDERVYVTEANGRVWALDRRTGAAVWRQDDLEGIRGTRPVAIGDVVVVGDERGRLTVMNAADGEILARVPFGAGISQAPVVLEDDLVVLTDEGRLLRLSLSRPE